MEIKTKITSNGAKWQLVCEGWSTSRAWGHKVTPIRNGYDYEPHSVRYLNRTWEMYTFQTCMSGAIETIYESEQNKFIENYKEKNNIDRFRKGEKDKVIAMFEQEPFAKELKEVKEAISTRNFD